MPVTLQQIADACGVSRGTVDRALHNKGGVRPEVAQRIRETARTMHYIPLRPMQLASDHPVRIGVVLHSANSTFVRTLVQLFSSFSSRELLPVEVLIRTMTGVDIYHQIALIDELLEVEQVDGFAIMPLAHALIRDKINELFEQQGIPVVTLNTDITDINRLAYVGPDNIASGRSAAALLGMVMRSRGQILPILGQRSGHYADSQRLTGFAAELSENFPDIMLLPTECCFLDSGLAERITQRAISANPHLNGIYISSVGREGVYAAIQKARAAGRVHIVVHDVTPDNIRMVREGVVDFVIGQDAKAQGTLPIRLLYEYLAKKISPQKQIYKTDIEIKFRCNITGDSE